MDQPGMIAADPARRGQLHTKKIFSLLSPFAPVNLFSRDGFGRPAPRQSAHLHTQAESGAYLRTEFLPSSAVASFYLFKRHRVSPEFIGSRNNCVPMAFNLVPAPSETCWFRGMSVGGSFRRV